MEYKDITFNFVYDFKFPNGFVDNLYGRNYISNYFLKQTEEVFNQSEQYISALPHEPSNFNKFEQGMFLDEYIDRNRNWKKMLLSELDYEHLQSMKGKSTSKEFFIYCLDSTPYSNLFDWFSDETLKLKDLFSPRFIEFFKKYDSFKILFMDIREGSYWMNPRMVEKVYEFLDDLKITANNKVIISNCNNSILEFQKDNRVKFYNNNYYVFKSGQFITECIAYNNKVINDGITYSIQQEINYEPKEKWFLNYNRNSGRHHRPYLVNKLYKQNLLNKGIVSLLQTDEFDDLLKYSREFPNIEIGESDIIDWKKSLSNWYPLVIDNGNEHEVAWYHNFLSRKDEYEKTWFSVVSETSADSEFLFITEKTMKPIMNLHPFIINGNPNTLKLLQSLGFKTFSKFWDESYDSETNFKIRIEKILKIIEFLCNKSQDEMIELIKSMEEILHYNKKHLQKLNRTKVFEKTFLENLETTTML